MTTYIAHTDELIIDCIVSLTMDAVDEVGSSPRLVNKLVKEAFKRICGGGHLNQRSRWFPFLNDVGNEYNWRLPDAVPSDPQHHSRGKVQGSHVSTCTPR